MYSSSYEDILLEEKARVLVNYAHPKQSLLGRVIPKGFTSVLIDSGVFQLQKGLATEHELNVSGYSGWLQMELPKHPEVDGYFAFDWGGQRNTLHDKENRLRYNYQYMLNQGLNPIPVWHPMWEGMSQLDFYARKSDYIALGGFASLGIWKTLVPLLTRSISLYPDHKFHLLGAGHPLLNSVSIDYAPYSIDVSTWSVAARFGNLLRIRDGKILELSATPKGVRNEDFLGSQNPLLREELRNAIKLLMSIESAELGPRDIQPLLF